MQWSFSTLGCPEYTLAEAMALAARFGLNGIELRTLRNHTRLSENLEKEFGDSELRDAGNFLGWWRDLRATRGWEVDVEIETHGLLLNANHILKLQQSLARPVDILWDSHHTWYKGEEDPLVTWAAIRQWVRHIHFKDSKAASSSEDGLEHTLPGYGDFPMEALFARLNEDGFRGAISLEWERFWCPELPHLETALRACSEANWFLHQKKVV